MQKAYLKTLELLGLIEVERLLFELFELPLGLKKHLGLSEPSAIPLVDPHHVAFQFFCNSRVHGFRDSHSMVPHGQELKRYAHFADQ